MQFWYKFITYLFYPLSHIYLLIRKLKKKEHPQRYKEKLAKINISREEGFLVWFHVASVGEGLSILPLIENFEKDNKIKQILITTITVSSADVLQERLRNSKKTIHQFLPLDIPKFVNKFLNHWKPNLSIFVDSEIWPNLIIQIKKNNIPLLLINGRITKKSFERWSIVINFAKKIFSKFDLCITANKETEKYLEILGVKKIKNYGNLKFANTKIEKNNQLNENQKEKIKNRIIWCAASTHASEEIFCAKTHLELKKTYQNILTVIIPRHVNRIDKIYRELLNLNLKTILFSNFDQINENIDVLLIDSYGKTSKFFCLTNCVFMGGSLIKHGGQNPLEPAKFGCKIFHGPNVNNFSEIYSYLHSLGAARQIHSVHELGQSIIETFETKEIKSSQIIEKIDNYGQNTLNSVIKDLKKYI